MQSIKSLFINPTRFFENHPPEHLRRSFWIIAATLAGAGLLLAVISYLNIAAIHAQYTGKFSVEDLPSPWQRLLFPVIWLFIVTLNSIFRFLTTRVLGDTADFATIAHICLHSAAPLMLAGFLIGVWTAIFPIGPNEVFTRGGFALVAFLLMFIYEGWICIAGLRVYLQQNTGRAILTWLAPFAGWCGCVAVPIAILYIALQL
ncbi:MAG: YIP1 family protein [bacterium]|nr:YIP1 family protein [bacterium]